MRKISAVIVDDEAGVRELLSLLLYKHCKNIDIVAEEKDVESAYEVILKKKPDLVFLDIQMPKATGFDLLAKFQERNFEVIFTTSYAEHAIAAFKVNALDYVLKPYDIEELKLAVEKAGQRITQKDAIKKKEEIFLTVHKNERVENINVQNILSLEAQNNYTLITTNDNQKHMISKVLSAIELEIEALGKFIRINRSVAINTTFIKTYSKTAPYTITLTNDASFEISRRRRSEILELLKNRS